MKTHIQNFVKSYIGITFFFFFVTLLFGSEHILATTVANVGFGLVMLFAIVATFAIFSTRVRHHSGKVLKHKFTRGFIAVWCVTGVNVWSDSYLVSHFFSVHIPKLTSDVLAGVFSLLIVAQVFTINTLALLLFLVLSVGAPIAVAVTVVQGEKEKSDAGEGSNKKKSLDLKLFGEKAPAQPPSGASWASIKDDVHQVVVEKKERASRLILGTAEIANDYNRRKKETLIALPEEGSGLLFGSAGSGKSKILQQMLLSYEPSKPQKYVVTSVKAEDLARPTVDYLRSQGVRVQIWDLTGTVQNDELGERISWSPLLSVKSWDDAKHIARDIVESAGGDQETNKFWSQQNTALLSCALLGASLVGQNYGTALSWAQRWSDPDFDAVDGLLTQYNEIDALRLWTRTRENLLIKKNGKWETKVNQNLTTGQNIESSLNGLLLHIYTYAVISATETADFDVQEWIASDTSEVLFLIGDAHEPEMSRSLLVPLVDSLIKAGQARARKSPGQRLEDRIVVLGDELPNLAPIPKLSTYFATLRSTNIQILACAQSFSQLERSYGKEEARTLLDASAVVACLSGLKDRDLIGLLSTIAGREVYESVSTSESKNDGKTNISTSTSQQSRDLIDGSTLLSLRAPTPKTPGRGLLVLHGSVARFSFGLWEYDKVLTFRGKAEERYSKQHEEYVNAQKAKSVKYWIDAIKAKKSTKA